jgi:hypothetical protein
MTVIERVILLTAAGMPVRALPQPDGPFGVEHDLGHPAPR